MRSRAVQGGLRRAWLLAGLAGAVLVGSAQAQTWAPVSSSDASTTAVGARWPNGTGAVARCRDGRFQLLFTVHPSIRGYSIEIGHRSSRAIEPIPTVWRMAPAGNATFARQPIRTAEGWLRGRTLFLTLPNQEEQELTPPQNSTALAQILADCDVSLDLTRPEEPVEITEPSWAQMPDNWVMTRYWPQAAMLQRLSGSARLNCIVAPNGELEDCIVVSETPSGAGFGAAALGLSSEFRMSPRQEDGVAAREGIVAFNVNFVMTDD